MKSHISFRLVSNSVILNDLEQRNDRYFALFIEFRRFGTNYVKE